MTITVLAKFENDLRKMMDVRALKGPVCPAVLPPTRGSTYMLEDIVQWTTLKKKKNFKQHFIDKIR